MKKAFQLNKFLSDNKQRTMQYLRNAFPSLSNDDTEDVYQDSSITLYLNMCNGKLASLTSSLYTYFLRICINLCLKLLSKRQRMLTVAISDGGRGQQVVSYASLERMLQDNEDNETLQLEECKQQLVGLLLSEMTDQCRKLLLGRYVEGESWSSIAQKNGLANADTAKSLACRYRKKLREKYMRFAAKMDDIYTD